MTYVCIFARFMGNFNFWFYFAVSAVSGVSGILSSEEAGFCISGVLFSKSSMV